MAIINNIKPFLNTGPGDIIREQMEVRDWRQEDLSEILGISLKHVNSLLQNKQQITLDMAKYLSGAFTTSPQYWINIDTNYRFNLKSEEDEKSKEIELKSEIFSKMPVRELYKKCWLKKENKFKDLLKQVLDFWNTESLNFDEIEKKFSFNLRKSEAYKQYNKWHLMCWMQMANNIASHVKVKSYNRKLLVEIFNRIKEYTVKETGVEDFITDLSNAGVKFILLEHLQKTYLDGASFLHENNPVVAYTARHNRVDNFWFTVSHEIAHILLHLKNKTDCFIDIIDNEYSGDKEKEADELASETLHLNEILMYFRNNLRYITNIKIEECSKAYNVHPAIIAGTLAHNGKISYAYTHLYNEEIKSKIPEKCKAEKYIC